MTATSQDQSEPGSTARIRREDLDRAVATGVIRAEQADALWRCLGGADATEAGVGLRPRFDLVHVLWYAGALIVIGAMGLFATLALARLGGGALAVIALTYAVLFSVAGDRLWRRGLMIPGGLLITVAVTMAPLFTYGVQDALGWLNGTGHAGYRGFYAFCRWSIGSWVPIELATIAAGLIALRFYRFPFLIAPIAVALWFMSLDLAPWVLGPEWDGWRPRRLVSLWFGLAVLVVAWVVDVRARGDFAFWLHLFGLLAFWAALPVWTATASWRGPSTV